jgi:pyridoxamine 5'-phosphate oxidase
MAIDIAGPNNDGLRESDVDPDPIRQFHRWFDAARQTPIKEPAAMTLATATPDGRPSARMVLLRGVDENGFVFFTNYDSRKGRELTANPHAALVFYWAELERQVRIEGHIAHVSAAESDAYFQTRPRGSRLSAVVSPQSEVIPNREYLERGVAKLVVELRDGHIPRPAGWGGYRLRPAVLEFWQGRLDRLHDRLRYTKAGQCWRLDRLAP